MNLKFRIEEVEYDEFAKSFFVKKGSKLWKFIFPILAVLMLINVLLSYFSRLKDGVEDTFSFLEDSYPWLAAIAILFVFRWYILKQISVKMGIKEEDKNAVLGERTMIFEEDKIQYIGATAETVYQWNAIKKWEQTTNLYLLYLTNNAAIMIPKRVFKDIQEQIDFVDLLNRKIQNLGDAKILDA